MSAIAQTFTDTAVLDLATLRQMTYAELDALYRGARCPSAIAELNGDTRGAMLAWRFPRTGPIAWWLRTYGAASAFPWKGKSFQDEVESNTSEPDQGPRHQPRELFRQTTLVSFQNSFRRFISRRQTNLPARLLRPRKPTLHSLNSGRDSRSRTRPISWPSRSQFPRPPASRSFLRR